MRAPSSDTSYFMTRFSPASPSSPLTSMRATRATSATDTSAVAAFFLLMRSTSLSKSALGYTMLSASMGCFSKNEPNDVASSDMSIRFRSMM